MTRLPLVCKYDGYQMSVFLCSGYQIAEYSIKIPRSVQQRPFLSNPCPSSCYFYRGLPQLCKKTLTRFAFSTSSSTLNLLESEFKMRFQIKSERSSPEKILSIPLVIVLHFIEIVPLVIVSLVIVRLVIVPKLIGVPPFLPHN